VRESEVRIPCVLFPQEAAFMPRLSLFAVPPHRDSRAPRAAGGRGRARYGKPLRDVFKRRGLSWLLRREA
jgi:hypothetical protein